MNPSILADFSQITPMIAPTHQVSDLLSIAGLGSQPAGATHRGDRLRRAVAFPCGLVVGDHLVPLVSGVPFGQSVSVTRSARRGLDDSEDDALLAFFALIASGDEQEVARHLDDEVPDLATRSLHTGATRQDPKRYFCAAISHYLYPGDTAMHIAAAAHSRRLADAVLARGADVRARNRRGAEPIHYAADGGPAANDWNPDDQHEVITYLIEAGADPNAKDNSGVAPLHRAVRHRSSSAVHALIQAGADPRLTNESGSTPLHLAVQNTGKGGSGSDTAHDEQRRIIALLLGHGGRPTDVDANGKTVTAAASSDWIRRLLDN